MTFGTPPASERLVSRRARARSALNALMGALYDVEPTPTHSDYLAAARELLPPCASARSSSSSPTSATRTAPSSAPALRLLRSRHLVLLASLRERSSAS